MILNTRGPIILVIDNSGFSAMIGDATVPWERQCHPETLMKHPRAPVPEFIPWSDSDPLQHRARRR
jgi:hypothetical protein